MATSFFSIYDIFLRSVTDDMYMELNEVETYGILQDLLLNALPQFEFPRFNINAYICQYVEDETTYIGVLSDWALVPCYLSGGGCFEDDLSLEEQKIIAIYMIVEWFGQQLASVELTRQKYTGSDFKMTSQAAHLQKILQLQKDYERKGFHLQRLYKRRKLTDDGFYTPTIEDIMEYDWEEDEANEN